MVAHYLATGGDLDEAIRLANAELPSRERTIRTEKTDLLALAPPAVFIAEPFERAITTDQPALRLKAEAQSFNRLPVEKIWVAVNGRRPDEGGMIRLDDDSRARLDVGLELSPGENHVAVYARNRHSRSEPEVVIVTRTSARASRRPNLYLLAIGVSEYANPAYNLSFAHKDAQAVTNILRGQQGKLYGRVESRCLADAEANREGVLAGLEWLTEASTQRDVAVIFLAGHGMKERGHYYFLPHDVDTRRLRVTGVRWSEFEHTFQDIPGTRWLLADTCRSGGITGKRATIPRDAGDMTDALRALKAVEGGVVVMSASTGQEASLESPQWRHGAFTKALIEGIGEEGRADHDGDGRVDIKELDLYLTDRVKELTKGKQHPMTEIPRMMSNFPVAIVAKKAQEKGG
uniref:Uncharacterized protein, contains caspase domain n=1 Tax=Candidatus Kentrum sp. UNK TaxID=2126344 RepID=A0A451AZX6_9GAMM|nr:MAG: Uncharacterized protein, contains caspase domain [Candidatus Kentron sp. UNK]VFK71585.1 MAG: Uncharacterized protein, contains caspase domain [Candidatus Kentron sp. UNK]